MSNNPYPGTVLYDEKKSGGTFKKVSKLKVGYGLPADVQLTIFNKMPPQSLAWLQRLVKGVDFFERESGAV